MDEEIVRVERVLKREPVLLGKVVTFGVGLVLPRVPRDDIIVIQTEDDPMVEVTSPVVERCPCVFLSRPLNRVSLESKCDSAHVSKRYKYGRREKKLKDTGFMILDCPTR